jgi:hypothetical protein
MIDAGPAAGALGPGVARHYGCQARTGLDQEGPTTSALKTSASAPLENAGATAAIAVGDAFVLGRLAAQLLLAAGGTDGSATRAFAAVGVGRAVTCAALTAVIAGATTDADVSGTAIGILDATGATNCVWWKTAGVAVAELESTAICASAAALY